MRPNTVNIYSITGRLQAPFALPQVNALIYKVLYSNKPRERVCNIVAMGLRITLKD
jgi:hypothetical protein